MHSGGLADAWSPNPQMARGDEARAMLDASYPGGSSRPTRRMLAGVIPPGADAARGDDELTDGVGAGDAAQAASSEADTRPNQNGRMPVHITVTRPEP